MCTMIWTFSEVYRYWNITWNPINVQFLCFYVSTEDECKLKNWSTSKFTHIFVFLVILKCFPKTFWLLIYTVIFHLSLTSILSLSSSNETHPNLYKNKNKIRKPNQTKSFRCFSIIHCGSHLMRSSSWKLTVLILIHR